MKYGLVLGLILLALVGRLVPHPANFTPMLAVALFAGALLPARLAYVVPLVAIALSDLIMGSTIDAMTVLIYGSLAVGAGLGQLLGKGRTWPRTIGTALGASVVFFIVTNFGVWALENMYPHTLQGLVECYVMAVPFFRNEVAGTLFWTAMLFGLYDLAQTRLHARDSHAITH